MPTSTESLHFKKLRPALVKGLLSAGMILLVFAIFHDLEGWAQEITVLAANRPLQYGLVSTALLVGDVVLPIPSTLVMYSNGAVFGFWLGGIASMLAMMLGAIAGYGMARGGVILFKGDKAKAISGTGQELGALLIVVSRGVPVLSESITLVCGLQGYPPKQFLLWNLLGYIPVCFLQSWFGSIGLDSDNFALSLALSAGLSLLFWSIPACLRRISKSKEGNPPKSI